MAYAKRHIHPQLNNDAKAVIIDFYTQQRIKNQQDESAVEYHDESEAIPVTPGH